VADLPNGPVDDSEAGIDAPSITEPEPGTIHYQLKPRP
jgi:hypothetical protein